MDYAKESLRLHEQWQGKIEVVATVPVKDRKEMLPVKKARMRERQVRDLPQVM